ncbi:MAG: sialidase family protein [Anaerolineae bacterium]
MQHHLISTKGSRLWQGIPAIERAANGRLWCAFFSGGPREPDPANHLLLTTSVDDGATWSDPAAVVDPSGSTRAYDPALWHDPSGRLWLFYNLANLETREFGVWALTTEDSSGANPAWSKPHQINLGVPFAFRLNKPTVIANGEWLLPVTWSRSAPEGWFPGDDQLQGVAISADRGASWSFHGAVKAPPWALENMIVDRRDGRLWMLIRTGSGVLWQSYSADGGRTWEDPTLTAIVNPGVRFFIRRLASGRLLLINTPDPHKRQSLRAYLSSDEDDAPVGTGLELDSRDRVSYPDAVQSADGMIYAVHDCDRQGAGEILLDVFTEEEVLSWEAE